MIKIFYYLINIKIISTNERIRFLFLAEKKRTLTYALSCNPSSAIPKHQRGSNIPPEQPPRVQLAVPRPPAISYIGPLIFPSYLQT